MAPFVQGPVEPRAPWGFMASNFFRSCCVWQRTSRQSIVSGLGLKVSDLGFSVQGPTTAAGNSTSVSGNLWCAINAIFRGSVTCSISEMPTTAILSVTKQVILDPFTLVAVSPIHATQILFRP